MPFSIRFHCRFSVQCCVAYYFGPFLKLPLAYLLGFGSLITLLLLSRPVYAEWVSVYSKPEEGQTVYTVYVDPQTIRRHGDLVKLWVLTDFTTIQTVPSPPYLSVKTQREIACAEKRIRLLSMEAFPSNMGTGAVLYSYSDANDQGIPVEPGSVAQRLWDVVCSKQ